MLIIDCHAHIYSPDEDRYQPIAQPLRVPGGKASIDDLRKTSLASGVTAVRAVQTVSFYVRVGNVTYESCPGVPGWRMGWGGRIA